MTDALNHLAANPNDPDALLEVCGELGDLIIDAGNASSYPSLDGCVRDIGKTWNILLPAIRELAERAKRSVELQLTEQQLRKLHDERVIVKFPDIEMAALVSYHPYDSDDYDEDDGEAVWLTNSLGGRSTYQDVIANDGKIFGSPASAQAEAAIAETKGAE